MGLYIGLMSGTSVDGVDAALVELNDQQIRLIDFDYQPFPSQLKQSIQDLSQPHTPIALSQYGKVDVQLGYLLAQSCHQLLKKNKLSATAITAIGSHGQTVYHAPNSKPTGFSLQIGDPNIIAEQTGITTVADFRRRDMAAHGQGAPLVPAFHRAIFNQHFDLSQQSICIVNIGGIANITCLTPENVLGFDTGPGNTLMDYWIKQHLQQDYDANGEWAKEGIVNLEWLNFLKQDLYFQLPPPKSTGKEYFSAAWLNEKLTATELNTQDVQASLCHLTAQTICDAIKRYAPSTQQTFICGGGAYNDHLIQLIKAELPHTVQSTAAVEIQPDHVEAMAFAWLARQTIHQLPGNLTCVTGANRAVILGAIYPGKNGLDRK